MFGWKAQEVAPGYWYFMLDGRKAAGMGQLSEDQQSQGIPAMWSSYVAVDDVDAIAARVPDLGGTVMMPPMDVMDAGRLMFVVDPNGAMLGFWQAGTHAGADVFNEPGAMSWNELGATDVAAAREFYSQLLPWQMEEQRFGDGFTYTMITLDGNPNGGIFPVGDGMPESAASWGVYFSVADADAAADAAAGNGGTVLGGPHDTPFGRMAVIADQQGAAFRVIKLTAPS